MEIILSLLQGIWMVIKSVISNPITLILLVLVILIEIFYSKFRGFMGEFWVKQELKKLPQKDYIVLNDIMLEDNNGTHQIDHLVISKYGIFVIEMKNYYGMILGEEYKSNWIQYLGKNKSFFKNPIHQNYGHIKSLEKILNIENDKFISIVCFSNQANMKIKTKSIVVQLDYLIKTIKSFVNIQIDSDINNIVQKIESLNITDKTKRKEHVNNIKDKIKENHTKEENMICPKCGNNLLQRDGKYGKFIGCSNYPKCKYIKK